MPVNKVKTEKKRIRVRLYRLRDMDLISLYLNDPESYIKHAENAIEAVMTGTKYTIPTPPVGFKNNYEGYLRPVIMVQFNVSGSTIRTLGKLKPRMMQSFINTCIRNCMEYLPIENFFKGDGIEFNKQDYELNRIVTDDETSGTKEEKPVKEKKEKKKPPKKRAPASSMQTIADQKIEELGRAAREELERKEAERIEAEKKEAERAAAEKKTVTTPETEVRPVSEPTFPAMPIAPIIETEDVKEETPATSTIQAAGQEDFPPMPIAPIIDDTPAEDDSDDSDMFAQLAELVHPH